MGWHRNPTMLLVVAVVLALAVLALSGTGAPSDQDARALLRAAATQYRTLPARAPDGTMIALDTAAIPGIELARCTPDPDQAPRGRNWGFIGGTPDHVCRYRVTPQGGEPHALVLRATRANPGPADQPTGNPLVDAQRRYVGGYRWSTPGAAEAARLLDGWTGE